MWWIKDWIETVIFFISAVIIYLIGLYQHSRIIKVCVKEKDMTWKLDVTNSILLLIHFGHKLLLHGVTFLVQDLSIYTGDWLCYISKVITHYLGLYTTAHSLVVGILKYFLVVHLSSTRDVRKEKIKLLFFYLNFLHPLLTISFHLLIRSDFYIAYDGFAQIDRCLGDPKKNWIENTNTSQNKLHNMCIFLVRANQFDVEYILMLIRWGACWLQVIVLYLITFNFFEIIVYCRIFSFMRR